MSVYRIILYVDYWVYYSMGQSYSTYSCYIYITRHLRLSYKYCIEFHTPHILWVVVWWIIYGKFYGCLQFFKDSCSIRVMDRTCTEANSLHLILTILQRFCLRFYKKCFVRWSRLLILQERNSNVLSISNGINYFNY